MTKGGANGYAALSKGRKGKVPRDDPFATSADLEKRRALDDYETPDDIGQLVCDHFDFSGHVYEPCIGEGRLAKVLRGKWGVTKVTGDDIKFGMDFLKRTARHKGPMVTNPPYRDGLAEKFARHALELADGEVAMLMQTGFLSGQKRAEGLYAEFKPCKLIIVPERVYFLVDGVPITSQFFSNVWICWPDRETRANPNMYDCVTVWPQVDYGF